MLVLSVILAVLGVAGVLVALAALLGWQIALLVGSGLLIYAAYVAATHVAATEVKPDA